jgi:dTDP-4-amino-4,6-dideoxygalactose transaminase
MISELINRGYNIQDPWDAVTIFENMLASYAGSKYAVCVDSCSNSIFLCLKYLNITGQVVSIPKHTYASVPMQIIHAGNQIKFKDVIWSGEYSIGDTAIVDAAVRFRKNMYKPGSYYCISFHHRKTLKLGRGGVILTDDAEFVKWANPMIYDGRNKNILYKDDTLSAIGYHMYMTPEDAARGILLLENIPEFNDDTSDSTQYQDLSLQPIFQNYLNKV